MSSGAVSELLVRKAPESTQALLELLFDGLDWPRPADKEIEDIPLLPWSPDELHLDPDQVSRLTKIQQLPNLTIRQPFGVFILSFDGGRLPVGAVRRVVNQLVRKKRARGKSARSLWDMNDLIFFCQSNSGVGTLHVVAFRDSGELPVMKVISWDTNATDNRLSMIANENLPALRWPDGGSLDADEWRDSWGSAFSASYREGIKSSSRLAEKMADVAKTVRDEVKALYSVESKNGPLRQLFDEVKKNLRADLTPESFSDMYAQTMVYGLLTARITHPEDFASDALNSVLKFENPFLDALYSSFRRKGDQAFDVDEFGLHDLAEVLSRANMDQVLADFGASERKDDPVVFFYEEFLERYDPRQRKELGTYYTPIPVVRFMVRAVDDIIKSGFGLPLGVADQTTWGEFSKKRGIPIPDGLNPGDKVIRMIDPATGTGTFLLEWIRQAEVNLRATGKYSSETMKSVVEQMDAFEISLSSYAVAHLKTSLELEPELRAETHLGIRLSDSLAGRVSAQLEGFGDDPIALEGQRAEQVKFDTNHSVVIGNPPYKDRAKGMGPLVEGLWPGRDQPLLSDFTPIASRGLGAHTKILRNLYVFFWRWALHKVFDSPPSSPGVVAFVTSSAWLRGPVFERMRSFIREGNDVWILDLNGDLVNHIEGDENIFDGIQLATAICLVSRSPLSNSGTLRFRSLVGTREMKFRTLSDLHINDDSWVILDSETDSPIGYQKSSVWRDCVPLGDLMPFHANGIHQQRTWVNDPSGEILKDRWSALVGARIDDRAVLMKETSSRTTLSTGIDLDSMKALGAISRRINSQPASIVRYSYRTLDRQWLLADSRVIDRPSPELWAVRGKGQIFLNEPHSFGVGVGPALALSAFIPNLHHFKGNTGGRIIPVFRDSRNVEWNLLPGFMKLLNERLVSRVDEQELVAYVVGLTAFPKFSEIYREDLRQGGVRIPIALDGGLIREIANLGQIAIELFTYGERTLGNHPIETKVRIVKGPKVRQLKHSGAMPDSARYDEISRCLHVGELEIEDVSPQVWSYEISGMRVVKKWLGYRMSRPSTKWSSPLNDIVTTTWPKEWTEELLDLLHVIAQLRELETIHEPLLERVLAAKKLNFEDVVAAGLTPVAKEFTKPKVRFELR